MSQDQLREKIARLIDELELEKSFSLGDVENGVLPLRHVFFRDKVAYNSVSKFFREQFEDYENIRLERVKSWAQDREGNFLSYIDLFKG